jgi:2-methylisocitrate lyase-like PEP mutase family enzyme
MINQDEKGKIFRSLHERSGAFVIPNPFDKGTARLLAHLGFEALATTSAGYAFSVGKQDNSIGRDEMLKHASEIVSATDLPVSADLENGFGDGTDIVAQTIRMAANAGLAGASIEDMTSQHTIYDLEHAADRVRAAAEIKRKLPFTFTLTARCENYLVGRTDLNDTIKRLQAYQDAGADVLYAPGLKSKEEIATLVRSVDRPVNVVMGLQGVQLNVAELSEIGVKRISVGSALSRAALGAFMRAAQEMKNQGTFTFANEAINYKEIMEIFGNWKG